MYGKGRASGLQYIMKVLNIGLLATLPLFRCHWKHCRAGGTAVCAERRRCPVRATGTGALPLLATEVSWAAVVMAAAAAADSARVLASRWRARRAAQRLGGATRGGAAHALAMLSSVRAALRFARARRWAAVSLPRAARRARACEAVLMFSRSLV